MQLKTIDTKLVARLLSTCSSRSSLGLHHLIRHLNRKTLNSVLKHLARRQTFDPTQVSSTANMPGFLTTTPMALSGDDKLKTIVAGVYTDLDNVSRIDLPTCLEITNAKQGRVLFDIARASFNFTDNLSPEANALIEAATPEGVASDRRQTRGQRAYQENTARLSSRLKAFASPSWVLFVVLLFSEHFRTAVSTLTDDQWNQLAKVLMRNQPSLELFSKVRGLTYHTMIDTDHAFFSAFGSHRASLGNTLAILPPVTRTSPHDFVVPGAWQGSASLLRSSGYGGRIDVDHNIFSPSDWSRCPKPDTWPSEWTYPHDPTTRRQGTVCSGCFGRRLDCPCTPDSSSRMLKPLVELYDYGKKGVGIRSLARIPKDKFIGEYVGRILPLSSARGVAEEGSGFSFDLDIGTGPESQVVGVIDSEHEGNFLRYINHSCDPNCTFQYAAFGPRLHILVSTLRPVDLYTELSIDYVEEYFTSDPLLLCQCGSVECAYRTIEDIQALNTRIMPKHNSSKLTNSTNVPNPPAPKSHKVKKIRPRPKGLLKQSLKSLSILVPRGLGINKSDLALGAASLLPQLLVIYYTWPRSNGRLVPLRVSKGNLVLGQGRAFGGTSVEAGGLDALGTALLEIEDGGVS